MTTQVNITFPNGAPTQAHVDFANDAVTILEQVVNRAEFQHDVESAIYSSTSRDVVGGVTKTPNKEIALIIREGREFGTKKDGKINLTIDFSKTLNARIAGQVLLPNTTIVTNSDFFEECFLHRDKVLLAAVWMHEWMHVAGFRHASKDKRMDVPSQIEAFVRRFGSPGTGDAVPTMGGPIAPRTTSAANTMSVANTADTTLAMAAASSDHDAPRREASASGSKRRRKQWRCGFKNAPRGRSK